MVYYDFIPKGTLKTKWSIEYLMKMVLTGHLKVNGHYMDSQSTYIQDVLRNEWHFDGLVMSDWGGTTNSSLSVKYG